MPGSVRPLTDQEEPRIVKARIYVTLKPGVLDPQGKAIQHALTSLSFEGVEDVRQGKFFEVKLASSTREDAEKKLDAMCKQLLANTVIENYAIELE